MADELPDPQCLIVADADVLIRNGLAEYLRHCGYKVFEAATSDEVITALEEGAAKIDALM
jgi:DNA-binding response OmpR family regulator